MPPPLGGGPHSRSAGPGIGDRVAACSLLGPRRPDRTSAGFGLSHYDLDVSYVCDLAVVLTFPVEG